MGRGRLTEQLKKRATEGRASMTNARRRQAQGVKRVKEDRDQAQRDQAHDYLAKALTALTEATQYIDNASLHLKNQNNPQARNIGKQTRGAADQVSKAWRTVQHMAAALNQIRG